MSRNTENKTKKRSLRPLVYMFKYMMRYKWRLLIVLAVVITSNIAALFVPKITGDMVDCLDLSLGTIDFKSLFENGMLIILIAVMVWALSAVQNRMMLSTAQSVIVDLRHDVFDKLTKLPVSFFDNNTKGNIISIISADVENISDTVSNDLITLITGFVTLIGALVMMLKISLWLSLIFVVTIPLMIIVSRKISKNARRLFREKKNNYGALCGYAEEMITGQKTVKVYGIEEYNEDKFKDLSENLCRSGSKAEFVSSAMMPSMNALNNINFTAICAVGAILAVNGMITVGNISTFVLYSKKFSHPIIDTANIINMLQTTLAACDRVFSIVNAEPEASADSFAPPLTPNQLKEIKGEIKFENVFFSYIDGVPVLKNVNLTIRPGEKVAVVGATGSGKTTMISLLLRFYEVTSGRITIDGIDIKTLPLNVLRQYYALVLQDSWLFQGTVMDNIVYAAPEDRRSPEEVKKLCRQIEVEDFISTLDQGYNSILRSDSGGLSQGQRQTLNIARAFLCDPPIFILDEATSSVDTIAEAKIKTVTDNVTKGKTSLIIAHRLSTILNADKIILMKDGEICETGTHDELMEQNGFYRELYESQFAVLTI